MSAVDDLRAEVAVLRAELAAFRAEMAREVRTERLAVVHPSDGRELIATNLCSDFVELRVEWGEGDDPSIAIGAGAEDGGEAWCTVTGPDGCAGVLEVSQTGSRWQPAMWVDRVGRRRRPHIRIDPDDGLTQCDGRRIVGRARLEPVELEPERRPGRVTR